MPEAIKIDKEALHTILDPLVVEYNRLDFIENDPLSIPHQFTREQDIEIMGFWTAMMSWGQRKTIINKASELIELMDGAPYDFIVNHSELERQKFKSFKHRTFNYTDTLYFLHFLQKHYRRFDSLENAFSNGLSEKDVHAGPALAHFHEYFFSDELAPDRTKKHVSTPRRNSACKRLNMFLRWMVRKDDQGVDFGLWEKIKPSQLLIPFDVHVEKVARRLNLIVRKQKDWKTVLELSAVCRQLDPKDPAKYDFALFGWSVNERQSSFKI